MKEGALVGAVTIGLLLVLVGIVASGVEDSGILTTARHFPVTAEDLKHAGSLADRYLACQTDFVKRYRTQYPVAAVLASSSAGVCAGQLQPVSRFLVDRGYPADIVEREVRYLRGVEDARLRRIIDH